MTQIVYTTDEGFKYLIEVPDGLKNPKMYRHGVRIGPPELTDLGLDEDTERILSNTLCDRQLYDYQSLNGRRGEVQTILQDVLKLGDRAQARDMLRSLIGIYQRAAFD